MTNREAIEELKPLTKFSVENGIGNFPMVWRPSQVEALNLAIKALEEQERPTGKWIESKEHFYMNELCKEWTNFYCSECDVPSISPSNYCPNCGARMEAENE